MSHFGRRTNDRQAFTDAFSKAQVSRKFSAAATTVDGPGRGSPDSADDEDSPSSPSTLAEDLHKLKHWLSSNGAFLGDVDVGTDSTGGLGLVSTRSVETGERLIGLPKHLQLTYDESGRGEDAPLMPLIERVPDQLWGVKLGLKLLAERAKVKGEFWPYISNLPQKFSVPMFWAGNDIQALQYPPVIEQIKMRCRFLLNFAGRDLPEVPSLPLFADGTLPHPFRGQPVDANALGWAMAAVSSRAFRVHGPTKPAALLPLVDMSNHSFQPTCRLQVAAPKDGVAPPPGMLEVVALSDLEPGSPLLLDYGPLRNDFLLLDYGFIVEDNPHDRVDLRFDLNLLEAARVVGGVDGEQFGGGDQKRGNVAPWQQAVLTQLRLAGPQAQLQVGIGGPEFVEGRFMAALRTLYARTPADLKGKDLKQLQNPRPEGALGPSNEKQVLHTVIGACAVALSRFPSTAKQDEELLEAGGLSEGTEMAVRFRLGKKRLLTAAIGELSRRLQEILAESARARTASGSVKKGKGFG